MVSLLLSDDDFFALMDIYTLLGGLTVKFPSSKIIPCIRHHTSSIRHRLDSCGIFAVNPLEMLTGGPPVSKTPNLQLVLRPLFIEVCGIFSWRLGQDTACTIYKLYNIIILYNSENVSLCTDYRLNNSYYVCSRKHQ